MADISAWIVGNTMRVGATSYNKNNTCTGKPDRKGQLALEAVAKHIPLQRSRIRSDAKLAA
eukprot:11924582-Heterocapsa_arctica.AAC.1